jgi:hypothetical protein
MEDLCPFKPTHSVEWLENYFAENCFKKPYDRFMWWRGYVTKQKPLYPQASFKAKVENGDFDYPHYRYEAELVEHKLRHAYLNRTDIVQFNESQSLNMARRKRLLEDHDKEENKRLEALYKECWRNYRLSKEKVEEEIMNLDGDTVKDLYLVLEEKYGYKPTPMPKFK